VTGLILALRGLQVEGDCVRRRGRPRPLRLDKPEIEGTCSKADGGELRHCRRTRPTHKVAMSEQVVTGHLRRRPKSPRRPAKGAPSDIPATAPGAGARWRLGRNRWRTDTLYPETDGAGPMQNFVYLIGDPETAHCIVVEPRLGDRRHFPNRPGPTAMRLNGVLVTHTHQDHVGGHLSSATISWGGGSPRPELPPRSTSMRPAWKFLRGFGSDLVKVNGGDTLEVGRVKDQPSCHPRTYAGFGSALLVTAVDPRATRCSSSCGRTDLPGSRSRREMLHDFAYRRLGVFPTTYRGLPGHNIWRQRHHHQAMRASESHDALPGAMNGLPSCHGKGASAPRPVTMAGPGRPVCWTCLNPCVFNELPCRLPPNLVKGSLITVVLSSPVPRHRQRVAPLCLLGTGVRGHRTFFSPYLADCVRACRIPGWAFLTGRCARPRQWKQRCAQPTWWGAHPRPTLRSCSYPRGPSFAGIYRRSSS